MAIPSMISPVQESYFLNALNDEVRLFGVTENSVLNPFFFSSSAFCSGVCAPRLMFASIMLFECLEDADTEDNE